MTPARLKLSYRGIGASASTHAFLPILWHCARFFENIYVMKQLQDSSAWPVLKTGDAVSIAGTLLTCRDATLRKIFDQESDFSALLKDKIVYFCGPTPAPPGFVIGSCGPTTSSRMEPYFEKLCQVGIRGIIGKGEISAAAAKILTKFGVIYFSGIGGAGAYLATKVKASRVIAFPELGPEAVFELLVEDFPAVVLQHEAQ